MATSSPNAVGRSEFPDVPMNNAAVQEAAPTPPEIALAVDSFKLEVEADRNAYIKKKMEENQNKLADITDNLQKLSTERANHTIVDGDNMVNLLTRKPNDDQIDHRQSHLGIRIGSPQEGGEHALVGSGTAVGNSVKPVNLPEVDKLPGYGTWNFMDRNQRSTGKKVNYDQNRGKGPINEEVNAKEFVASEDKIIRKTVGELGPSYIVFDVLGQRLSRKPSEVKARYEALVTRQKGIKSSKPEDTDSYMNSLLSKHLEEAQRSFDYLFCPKCLKFGCKLHGLGQELKFPAKKLTWEATEEEKPPCGPNCYFQVQEDESISRKKVTDFNGWRTLEKDLFEKGVEMFGNNSCLIARNLLGGLKTCKEVFDVLNKQS